MGCFRIVSQKVPHFLNCLRQAATYGQVWYNYCIYIATEQSVSPLCKCVGLTSWGGVPVQLFLFLKLQTVWTSLSRNLLLLSLYLVLNKRALFWTHLFLQCEPKSIFLTCKQKGTLQAWTPTLTPSKQSSEISYFWTSVFHLAIMADCGSKPVLEFHTCCTVAKVICLLRKAWLSPNLVFTWNYDGRVLSREFC